MYFAIKNLFVLSVLVANAWAIPRPAILDEEWSEYKKSFGKFYTSESEDEKRLNAYLETKRRVEEHNRKYDRGETKYTMGMNKFADWFPEELDRLNGLKIDQKVESEERKVLEVPQGVEVPDEIDWVKKGAVTSVKDQGQCGSCYAFSAVGALEGLMFNTNKTITDLSAQELVDCTFPLGNEGCDGGWTDICFNYVGLRRGISTDKSYPYETRESMCRARGKKTGASCNGYVTLVRSEENMKNALALVGPITIGFAVSKDFISYRDGIFNGGCSSRLNHAMLVVGYGKDNATQEEYWLVKNSWGEKWGLNGYIKVIKGVDKCGISYYSSYPVFEK